jgi:hypothetical protein
MNTQTLEMPTRNLTDIRSSVEQITPELAAKYLATSKGNRPINKARCDRYGKEMTMGQWVLNGEAVIFNANNELQDGHHRLTACVNSKASFVSVVIRNVSDPRAFMTIDQGSKKTGGDIFSLAGVVSSRSQSATQHRYAEYVYSIGKMSVTNSNVPFEMTAAAMLNQYQADPESFDHSQRMADAVYRSIPTCNIPMMAACHYMFATKSRAMADAFFEQIASGENLVHGDPAYMLRDAWIRRAGEKHKENLRNMMVKTVHAWNAYRNHRRIAVLRHNSAAPVPAFI